MADGFRPAPPDIQYRTAPVDPVVVEAAGAIKALQETFTACARADRFCGHGEYARAAKATGEAVARIVEHLRLLEKQRMGHD